MDALAEYVEKSMEVWAPLSTQYGESSATARARYESIATDISAVVRDPSNAPLPGLTRWETALVLANLAGFEGYYWAFVDDGRCNDAAVPKDPRGDCDNREAFSLWQIHPDRLPLGMKYTGAQLVADRKVAIRVALEIARVSMKRTGGTLTMYTGESLRGPHPLADVRLERAIARGKSSPFVAP